ncbi:MoaD/ThiS family protein [Thermosphaera chiliense]|uniref:MoaD/ThiS family protein n=1 Tax=Thermosphaera chiliense TaxID=3402707 RepID=A0A7M1UQ96_9CREN|nr:MoaD/ThiS family protein [Thermosphaera aggregans]QOR94438.1 MoaD/ThiS family protein [Thermosphaera aggregans]
MPVKVTVTGEKEPRIIEASRIRVKDLLAKLGLNPTEYVVLKDGEILVEDDEVVDGDAVTVFTVKSGG